MYIYIYTYVYICIYIYTYMCIYIYIFNNVNASGWAPCTLRLRRPRIAFALRCCRLEGLEGDAVAPGPYLSQAQRHQAPELRGWPGRFFGEEHFWGNFPKKMIEVVWRKAKVGWFWMDLFGHGGKIHVAQVVKLTFETRHEQLWRTGTNKKVEDWGLSGISRISCFGFNQPTSNNPLQTSQYLDLHS